MSRPAFKRRRKARQLPFEATLVEVGNIVTILDRQVSSEVVPQLFESHHLYRRPNLTDCEEAPFLLTMRTNDTVRSAITRTVESSILIGALDAFIYQSPEEPAATCLALANHLPVVPHACADSAVVKPVEKLSRHIDVRTIRELRMTIELFIMICVGETKLLPGMEHLPFLRIPTHKLIVVLFVPAAFIAVVPQNNTGMVYVAANHLTD